MKSIAQQCLEAETPYDTAYDLKIYYRQSATQRTFHFEDGSFLAFNVTYTPAEAGRTFPCQPQNTI